MKLSIITINYNNIEGLRRTMDSVFAQTCKDFEYIVVDGASTDGGAELLPLYEEKNNNSLNPIPFRWISENDSGIYEAMNKGVKMSQGEYSLMLNSADTLANIEVVSKILPELHTDDIIQGNTLNDLGDYWMLNKGYAKSNIDWIDAMDAWIIHQAAFCKKEIFERYGYFDESYKKGSDTYLFIRTMGLGNATFRYIDLLISNFDMHGMSCSQDPKILQLDKEEDERFYRENIPFRMMEYYRETPPKVRVYNQLNRNRIVWFVVRVLLKIVNKLYPLEPKSKKIYIKK